MPTEFTENTIIVATSDQVSTQVKGETVLLQLKNGKYYSLNRVGSAIWEHLREPTTVSALVNEVTAKFDVDRDQCEADVKRLVSSLADAGFVETRS